MARQERPLVSLDQFNGLNTADDTYEVGLDALTVATNIDITRKNKIVRRNGFTPKVSATVTAAWANERTLLYQEGTTLNSVDKEYNSTAVRTGLTPSDQLHAYQVSDCVYYSNGQETGCLENGVDRVLGVSTPPRAVLTELAGGNLPAGVYQVVSTLVRNDGFESGVLLPATSISLANAGGAIRVGAVSSLDNAVLVNHYITRPDGDMFYFAGQGPTGSTFDIAEDPSLLRRPMKAMNTNPPVPFSVVDQFFGRMIYGVGDTLYFSDPFAYERVDYTKGFIPFKNPVTMIGVVDSGFFVGTTKDTYFLEGLKIGEMDLRQVAPYGVVPNTRSYLDGTVVGSDSDTSKKIPAWISNKGMCIGFQDGSMQNVTQNTVILPEGITGASFFRQESGQNHFISVIRS